VGQTIQWVESSSVYAYAHRVYCIITEIRRKTGESVRSVCEYGEYVLIGHILRHKVDDHWVDVTDNSPFRVTWVYNDSVGGGFPMVISSLCSLADERAYDETLK
tara:strand:+ start:312 stop:623 length:312 start_codon:yes stop_codon:yes gene_type:complete